MNPFTLRFKSEELNSIPVIELNIKFVLDYRWNHFLIIFRQNKKRAIIIGIQG